MMRMLTGLDDSFDDVHDIHECEMNTNYTTVFRRDRIRLLQLKMPVSTMCRYVATSIRDYLSNWAVQGNIMAYVILNDQS